MSDSMRPRADDYVPPCMDFDNPGPHKWTRKRCSGCGKLEPLDEPAPLKEAVKPEPSLETIAERISNEVAKLFYGDISGGKSIQAVALRVLTEYADALKEQK